MSSGNEPVFELGGQSRHNESAAPSQPSLSSSVLSSLNGSTSINSGSNQLLEGEEKKKKKSKKHKHDKDKSRYGSRMKRRHGNSIVKSSKIAIASAENALKQSQDAQNNSQASNNTSSSQNSATEGASRSNTFNNHSSTGYNISMPLQFLHQYHPLPSTDKGGTGPNPSPADGVRSNVVGGGGSVFSSMMMPGSSISARNAAHQALFAGTGHSSSSQTAIASHQSYMFRGSVPYSLLTEEQFRLHNEANRINAIEGAMQGRQSVDSVILHESNSNLASHTFAAASSFSGQESAVPTINNGSSGSQICAQNTLTSIGIEELRALFHLSLVEAAKHLGMCTTLFKKICRKNNIGKWPYRKIHSLLNKVESLEHYLKDSASKISESVKKSYREQISSILDKVQEIKQSTGVDNKETTDMTKVNNPSISEGSVSGSMNSGNEIEKRSYGISSSNEGASESGSDGAPDGTRKRRRYETSYDFKTGWVANCSTCGKLGKYRHPSQGRVFQHSSGTGKYCGYFRDNPRQEGDGENMLGGSKNTNINLVPVSSGMAEPSSSKSSV